MTDRLEDVVVNTDKAVVVEELKLILKNACSRFHFRFLIIYTEKKWSSSSKLVDK